MRFCAEVGVKAALRVGMAVLTNSSSLSSDFRLPIPPSSAQRFHFPLFISDLRQRSGLTSDIHFLSAAISLSSFRIPLFISDLRQRSVLTSDIHFLSAAISLSSFRIPPFSVRPPTAKRSDLGHPHFSFLSAAISPFTSPPSSAYHYWGEALSRAARS